MSGSRGIVIYKRHVDLAGSIPKLWHMRLCYLSCLLLALATFLFATALSAQTLFRGMTEQELIEARGEPTSEAGSSTKKVLMFQGVTVELREGRLYSVEGEQMEYMTPDGGSQFNYMTSTGWTYNGEPVGSDFRATSDPSVVAVDKENSSTQQSQAQENRGLEEATTPVPPPMKAQPDESAMGEEDWAEDDLSAYEDWEEFEYEEPTLQEIIIELAILFIVEFLLTLLILKIAFEQKGFPVLLPQLLLISILMSIISLGASLGLEAIGFESWALYQGINYIALSVLIYLISDVRESVTAMTIALIARGVTAVVNYFILLGSMYLFFG